jgi:enoyl-CoA hydratase/carnithine racemase
VTTPPPSRASADARLDAETGVATVTFVGAGANYLDLPVLTSIADAIESLGDQPACRVIVLRSGGRHFSAGAALDPDVDDDERDRQVRAFYEQAARTFSAKVPVVAAVQGAAVGAGLGLALAADFRVATPTTRFAPSFARLGFFPGFATTVTLPRLVGRQRSAELLITGRDVRGDEAHQLGLCDRCVDVADLEHATREMAGELAAAAPLSARALVRVLRRDLVTEAVLAMKREAAEQVRLARTADFREGIAAASERRPPQFRGT